ncbi:MAG TPA: AAA family ATPase [Caulobacteraceae bacterium]|nr:AAA family ATPase [Caulobacteraceae bacterium]
MHVTRLRLSGFKSFVETTEFPVEPGLTGVIGPNGCGKSNLLEALRWVMGATSAKAMRGEGMEDVIFSGSSGRVSRNHAEVVITLDNADRTAPAAYAAHPVLQVSRRIERGAGSTYRINGSEVRARDVQLLFADASTGANSPALVRQGQISELIAAKPQNRRRILEEAAGVAGLHGRRHEAQLRVKGAEANLTRLDDLAREVESQQGRLRREARAAARYRTLAAQIRKVEAALMHARWAEAAAVHQAARAEAAAAVGTALTTAQEAARGAAALIAADAALPPLKEAAAAAAAILGRLMIEQDRAERDLASARAEAERLAGDVARLVSDRGRETMTQEDAQGALQRLTADLDRVRAEIADAPERLPALKTAVWAAEAEAAQRMREVEALAGRLAALQAEARAGAARVQEARERLGRSERALAQAQNDRAALGPAEDPRLGPARAAVETARVAEADAREALEAAEIARRQAADAESELRKSARAAEDALARRETSARGLSEITRTPAAGGAAPVLEQVTPEAGFEIALAAALGEDLSAGLDPASAAFWGGRVATSPVWPEGVTPLADRIDAPPALAARLAYVALVAREDGARLARLSPPGARLVSREGDLWRWDGLTVRSGAPKPAQVRLEQRARLAALEAEIAGLRPEAARTRADHEAAARTLAEAEKALAGARSRPGPAAAQHVRARETLEALEREAARREARAAALDETIGCLSAERDEAAAALKAAVAAAPADRSDDELSQELAQTRSAAGAAREAAFAARSALDRETAARTGRQRRLEQLERETREWTRRAATAAERRGQLDDEEAGARAALADAREAPERLERRRIDVVDETAKAQTRQAEAAEALAAAEAARVAAERAARQADARAADARETRAGTEARLEAAAANLASLKTALTEATGLEPEALARSLAEDAVALPAGTSAMEAHLAALERDLQALGAVNLRAEEESAELDARLAGLGAERDDLAAALARLRQAIEELNAEGRERLIAAFEVIDANFRDLFTTLFEGGSAELRLVESDDPLESGLEIYACPPGKRMSTMSLMSGGEQALTAAALIFAVFLCAPAPICVLDEVDAPLDDANVERFCNLLDAMRQRAATRFLAITHNPLTMSRMDRLFGVTMRERGVSQLVSVDLRQAEVLAAS